MKSKRKIVPEEELQPLSRSQLNLFKLLPTEEKLNHIYEKLLKLEDNDFI